MSQPHRLLIFLCLTALARAAHAQAQSDATAIADRYLAAMQRKAYSFLSKEELLKRHNQIAALVTKYSSQPLDQPTRTALLEGIDRCLDRLYDTPAGKVNYANGFGSGGEEWMYLNDRDFFLTFQYHLWSALTRPPLTPADTQRRDTQRQWMRQYLTALPHKGIQETPPRENIPTNDIRPGTLAELEKAFTDPLHLLSQPMPEAGFTALQDRFKQSSNGISGDFHDMEVSALTSRFISREDPAARYGYSYPGQLPFNDTVVEIWGNAPHLCFASNADFRGHDGQLTSSSAFDIIRCISMSTADRRGELTIQESNLRAVANTKMIELPIKTWFEADKLSNDQLHALIRTDGRDKISIARLPTINGFHRGDRSEGEFFIAVQNPENRLAILNLHNLESNQLLFWCRPRPPAP